MWVVCLQTDERQKSYVDGGRCSTPFVSKCTNSDWFRAQASQKCSRTPFAKAPFSTCYTYLLVLLCVVILCVAAPPGRRRPSGARKSQLFGGVVITKVFSKIPENVTTTTLAYYRMRTSGIPEVCQLPAGMADKNKLVLYHPLCVSTQKQNKNRPAVRQCSSTHGCSKGQRSAAAGTVVLPSTSGRPVF